MTHIDERFKDCSPEETVKRIQDIMEKLGIVFWEKWNDTGLTYCNSMNVFGNRGLPVYSGKGVTPELARASGYAEFIERLQGDLSFMKFQSIKRQKEIDIQTYAPDGKLMTVEELIENGEWMDYIVDYYQDPRVTRQSIAEYCRIFAFADDGKILTVPFYSLFEDKYIYLPIEFVNHIYGSNGCCAGNSREEAWIHGLSEMMERCSTLRVLLSGKAAPIIPLEDLRQYSTASSIIDRILATGQYEIEVFDYSFGSGLPVIATRIIDKINHNYCVNIGADPVFEIALNRTFTELFQGRNIENYRILHSGKIMKHVTDFPIEKNIINQLGTCSGVYTADFFANIGSECHHPSDFPDNSNKTNKELFDFMIDLYRKLGKPVYVRNFSFLGFPSYRFVVPGFSECKAYMLKETVPSFALADSVVGALRDPAAASNEDLEWLLYYFNSFHGQYGKENHFARLSGVPLSNCDRLLSFVTKAYAAYRLGKYKDCKLHLAGLIRKEDDEVSRYFSCVGHYLQMKLDGIEDDKIRIIMYKFCCKQYVDKLYEAIDSGKTPFDSYLLSCDYRNCENCSYNQFCSYQGIRDTIAKIGPIYAQYGHGQDRSELQI